MSLDDAIVWQRRRQKEWREVPAQGRDISFANLSFRVYPGVFWPFEDSLPLIENMRIEASDVVLDVGTGAGTVAIHAARKGARRVLGVDRNPSAIRAASENARRLGVDDRMEVRVSDVFDSVGGERFDVITANLPWLERLSADDVESAQWDTDFLTNRRFFSGLSDHLRVGGRVYYSQGNYGAVDMALRLMQEAGFHYRLIGKLRSSLSPELLYYAFELRRVGEWDGVELHYGSASALGRIPNPPGRDASADHRGFRHISPP